MNDESIRDLIRRGGRQSNEPAIKRAAALRCDATVQLGMPRFGATDSTSQAAARECKRFLPAGGFFELVNRSQFQSSIPFRRGKGEYSRPAGHLSLGTAFYSLII